MGRVEATLVLDVFNVGVVVVGVDATGSKGKVGADPYEFGGGAGTPPTPF